MFIDLRPPDLVELVAFLHEDVRGADPAKLISSAGRALQGLTARRSALCPAPRAARDTPMLGPESLPFLLEEKRLLVNRSGVDRVHRRRRSHSAISAAWKFSRSG